MMEVYKKQMSLLQRIIVGAAGIADKIREYATPKNIALVGTCTATAIASSGCFINRHTYNYGSHILGGLNTTFVQRPAYNGEVYFLQDVPKGKQVRDVVFTPNSSADFRLYAINPKGISITTDMKSGAKKGFVDVSYTILYEDGTSESKTGRINLALENKNQNQHRQFREDREALSNLVDGIYVIPKGENEGKRFMPNDPTKIYIPGQDFLRLNPYQVDKQCLGDEANMDMQQSWVNFLRSLPGGKNPQACYINPIGELRVFPVTGVLEGFEYALHHASRTIFNASESILQGAALYEGGARKITGLHDIVDAASDLTISSSPVGAAQRRTAHRVLHMLFSKEPITQESMLKGKKDIYHWAVRPTPFRGKVEAIGTATFDTFTVIYWVKNWANRGDDGGGIGEQLPMTPKGAPGEGGAWGGH